MNIEEIKELNEFVNRYKEIEHSIDLMQKSIQSLAEKRDKLLEELDDLQTKEIVFMNSLIDKYGASEITPFKLLQIYQNNNEHLN
jgi:peptidoglycan hydrolase CwlO-like protein